MVAFLAGADKPFSVTSKSEGSYSLASSLCPLVFAYLVFPLPLFIYEVFNNNPCRLLLVTFVNNFVVLVPSPHGYVRDVTSSAPATPGPRSSVMLLEENRCGTQLVARVGGV